MGNSSQFRILAGRLSSRSAVLAGLLYLCAVSGWAAQQKAPPDAQFRTISGDTLHLSEFRGKPVLLSFWSTSCAVCIQEMPEMSLLYHTLKEAGVDMVSITMPYDPPNLVVEAAKRLELPFPVAIDLDGTLMKSFSINGTPIKVLISPQGNIARTFVGALDYAKTLDAAASLVAP